MTLFLVRRIMQGAVTIFVMSVIVFVGVYAIGNPVEILINPDATPDIKQQAIEKLGLDKPILEQYGTFVWQAAAGKNLWQLTLPSYRRAGGHEN